MTKNKQYNMALKKSKNLTIIEKNGKISLQYIYKINKKTIKRKNKAGTINTYYQGFMPAEIVDYIKVKENTLFFYKAENEIRITTVTPTIEHQQIKLQKYNQFSLPKSYLEPEKHENVKLVIDFSRVDDYKNGLGVLTIELI